MTTTATTVVLINGEFEAHKAGCAHLRQPRIARNTDSRLDFVQHFSTRTELASEMWSDFLSEWEADGDDAAERALSHMNFAPCLKALK